MKSCEICKVGGRYGVAIEEAVKAEMRGQPNAAGDVIELMASLTKSHPTGPAVGF